VATQLAELSARVHQQSLILALADQKCEAWDAELRTLRGEIGILRSKAAAAEERAFYTAATVKEVQQALKEEQENVSHVEEKLADTRSRLRDVEDGHRKIEDSMRSKTRDTIELIKNHVVKQKQRHALLGAQSRVRQVKIKNSSGAYVHRPGCCDGGAASTHRRAHGRVRTRR